MKTKSYNVGVYDKCNNLVNYREILNDAQELKCYYSVNGNVLNKKYANEDPGLPSLYVSSVVEFSENIMLYPIRTDGETCMRTIKSGTTFSSFKTPNVSNRFDTYTKGDEIDSDIQYFSVKSNLVDEWLNKL